LTKFAYIFTGANPATMVIVLLVSFEKPRSGYFLPLQKQDGKETQSKNLTMKKKKKNRTIYKSYEINIPFAVTAATAA
jgi:hypothetical protein